MSTPLAPTSRTSAPVHPTRQQLDELDALLQRMLDLPVNQVDEEADEAPAGEAPAAPRGVGRREDVSAGGRRAAPGPAPQPAVSYRVPELPPAPRPPVAPPAPAPEPPARSPASYPASYMVVETATPRLVAPAPPEPEPEVDDSGAMDLQPRVVPPVELPERPGPSAALPPTPPDYQEGEEPAPSVRPPAGDRVEPEAEWVPLRSSWQPSPQTWQPLADTWHQHRQAQDPASTSPPPAVREPAAGDVEGPTIFEFHSHPAPSHPDDVSPPVAADEFQANAVGAANPSGGLTPPAQEAPPGAAFEGDSEPGEEVAADTSAGAPVAWPLLPLAWFNAAFDACMSPLGPLGRVLCGRAGRSFLGSLGLLCLAAALALYAAFRIGWTW